MSEPTLWKFSSQSDDQKTYFAFCKVTEKSLRPFHFDLTLFSGGDVWNGQISNEKLVSLSEKANLPINEYCFVTRRALTGDEPEEVDESFAFIVEKSFFFWKKKISDKVQYQLGSVELKKLDDQELSTSFEWAFDFCLRRINDLSSKNETLEQENFSCTEERLATLERVKEAIKAKEECENILISKFVDVLNSKKRKIVELQQEDSSTLTSDIGKTSDKNGDQQIPDEKSGTDDVSDMDTDEENDRIKKKRTLSNPDPILADEDLILHSKKAKSDESEGQPETERLFVPKRESRPSRKDRKKEKPEEQAASTSQKNVQQPRRSTRNLSQTSTSSLLDKLS